MDEHSKKPLKVLKINNFFSNVILAGYPCLLLSVIIVSSCQSEGAAPNPPSALPVTLLDTLPNTASDPEVGNAGHAPLFDACAVRQGFNDGATNRGGAGLALQHQIF